jgi:hypothetical protein
MSERKWIAEETPEQRKLVEWVAHGRPIEDFTDQQINVIIAQAENIGEL